MVVPIGDFWIWAQTISTCGLVVFKALDSRSRGEWWVHILVVALSHCNSRQVIYTCTSAYKWCNLVPANTLAGKAIAGLAIMHHRLSGVRTYGRNGQCQEKSILPVFPGLLLLKMQTNCKQNHGITYDSECHGAQSVTRSQLRARV